MHDKEKDKYEYYKKRHSMFKKYRTYYILERLIAPGNTVNIQIMEETADKFFDSKYEDDPLRKVPIINQPIYNFLDIVNQQAKSKDGKRLIHDYYVRYYFSSPAVREAIIKVVRLENELKQAKWELKELKSLTQGESNNENY